jgi:uncharacterized protein (TIGR03083 family)
VTVTTIDVQAIDPLTHGEAMMLQAHELEATLVLLRSFDEAEWRKPTDCPGWDVRAMYQHVLGACEAGASMRENVHQLRRGRALRKEQGIPLEAALSTVQVADRARLEPTEIIQRLEAVAPKTVRGRSRTPALIRDHIHMTVDGPVFETWKIGYLIDIIYLRDLWMHRVDAARAAGRPNELRPEHDGRIVADVVAEWARRHADPFLLDLAGTAGGRFAHDPETPGAEHLSLDGVEFCRTLAGRSTASGLLSTVVPF